MVVKKVQAKRLLPRLDRMRMVVDIDPIGQIFYQQTNQSLDHLGFIPTSSTEELDQRPITAGRLTRQVDTRDRMPSFTQNHTSDVGGEQGEVLTTEQVAKSVYYRVEQGTCYHDYPPFLGREEDNLTGPAYLLHPYEGITSSKL